MEFSTWSRTAEPRSSARSSAVEARRLLVSSKTIGVWVSFLLRWAVVAAFPLVIYKYVFVSHIYSLCALVFPPWILFLLIYPPPPSPHAYESNRRIRSFFSRTTPAWEWEIKSLPSTTSWISRWDEQSIPCTDVHFFHVPALWSCYGFCCFSSPRLVILWRSPHSPMFVVTFFSRMVPSLLTSWVHKVRRHSRRMEGTTEPLPR